MSQELKSITQIIENNIKNCFKQVEENLFQGKDLYDYSKLEDIYYSFKIGNDFRDVNISTDEGYYFFINTIEKDNNFVDYFSVEKHGKLEKNEKIVFLWENCPKHNITTRCDNNICNNNSPNWQGVTKMIIITNYSRIFSIEKYYNDNGKLIYNLKFSLYNFWLPTDYILILKSLVPSNYKHSYRYKSEYCKITNKVFHKMFPNYGTQIDPNTIFSTLEMMKSTLYDRKFIPLYFKDVTEENKMLKEENKMLKEKLELIQKTLSKLIS